MVLGLRFGAGAATSGAGAGAPAAPALATGLTSTCVPLLMYLLLAIYSNKPYDNRMHLQILNVSVFSY